MTADQAESQGALPYPKLRRLVALADRLAAAVVNYVNDTPLASDIPWERELDEALRAYQESRA